MFLGKSFKIILIVSMLVTNICQASRNDLRGILGNWDVDLSSCSYIQYRQGKDITASGLGVPQSGYLQINEQPYKSGIGSFWAQTNANDPAPRALGVSYNFYYIDQGMEEEISSPVADIASLFPRQRVSHITTTSSQRGVSSKESRFNRKGLFVSNKVIITTDLTILSDTRIRIIKERSDAGKVDCEFTKR